MQKPACHHPKVIVIIDNLTAGGLAETKIRYLAALGIVGPMREGKPADLQPAAAAGPGFGRMLEHL